MINSAAALRSLKDLLQPHVWDIHALSGIRNLDLSLQGLRLRPAATGTGLFSYQNLQTAASVLWASPSLGALTIACSVLSAMNVSDPRAQHCFLAAETEHLEICCYTFRNICIF